MDTANIIAIAVIVGVIVTSVAISLAIDRLARARAARAFRAMEPLLDSGSAAISPGPAIRGSFHGREIHAFYTTELRGITQRGGSNGKVIFQLACSTDQQFTAFTFPRWPAMAELLRLGSPRVASGDPELDRTCGFASPLAQRFQAWAAQPESKAAIRALMSAVPPSRTQRLRVRVEGKLEVNMPGYLFVRMKRAKVQALLEDLDRFAGRLEQA